MEDIDLEMIFPGLLEGEDQELVNDLLLDGEFQVTDLERRALEIVSEVSGRPWWVALRMIQLAEMRWSILGAKLIWAGINPTAIPLGAWLDALWVAIFESLSKDQWTMLASLIEAIPASEMPEDPLESLEMSSEAFAQFMRE